MTRQEFEDNVTTWWELRDFCDEQRCDVMDGIYDEADYDDYINECLVDWARNDTWEELRNRLNDIPSGYDYYRHDDYDDWEGLDDTDFRAVKAEVAERVDDYGCWDDEDEEDEEDDEEEGAPYIDPEDTIPIEDEDCTLGELFSVSVARVHAISEEELEAARAEELAFATMIAASF